MKNTFYLLLILFVSLSSCQKEMDEAVMVSKNEVSEKFDIFYPAIVGNRLYFTDKEDFERFMTSYSKIEPESIDLLHKNNGFKSWNFIENNEQEHNVPNDANNLVETFLVDPWLTRVLNYNQEIKVGEVIYRVEDDYVFMYVDGHFSEIADFKISGLEIPTNEGTLINDKLVAFKQTTSIEEESYGNTKAWLFGFGIRNYTKYDNYNSTTRMRSNHWATNVYFYKSAGLKTQMQKYKGWWIFKSWKSQNAKTIYVKGRYDMQVTQPGHQPITQSATFNITKYNKSSAVKKMFEAFGFGVSISGSKISGISGAPGATYKILKSTFSNHYTKYGSSSKSRGPINWKW